MNLPCTKQYTPFLCSYSRQRLQSECCIFRSGSDWMLSKMRHSDCLIECEPCSLCLKPHLKLAYFIMRQNLGTMGTIFACDWLRKDPDCRVYFDSMHSYNWFTSFFLYQTAMYNGLMYGLQFPSLVRPFFFHHMTAKSFSPWPTWITSAFNHNDGIHLLTNMFYMWCFSCNDHVLNASVTDYIDTFLCGALWCGASVVVMRRFALRRGSLLLKKIGRGKQKDHGIRKTMVSCGASGGVSGVGGGLAYVHWDNETKFNPIPFFNPFAFAKSIGIPAFNKCGIDLHHGVEARTITCLFLLLELRSMFVPSQVAHFGHLCGFAGGAFTAWLNNQYFGITLFEDKKKRCDWSQTPEVKKLYKFFKAY